MQHSRPGAPVTVGFARTATIAGLAPSPDPVQTVRARRMAYCRSMAAGQESDIPTVAVIEDTDYPHCIAGWWGEVNVAVHKGLGIAGAVTNGVMRDLDVLDEGFAVLDESVGPSHGHLHVTGIGGAVTVMGLSVAQGDLIHADRHGAIVIPPEAIPTLEAAIRRVEDSEAIVLGPARAPGFDIEKLEGVWAAFEAART